MEEKVSVGEPTGVVADLIYPLEAFPVISWKWVSALLDSKEMKKTWRKSQSKWKKCTSSTLIKEQIIFP